MSLYWKFSFPLAVYVGILYPLNAFTNTDSKHTCVQPTNLTGLADRYRVEVTSLVNDSIALLSVLRVLFAPPEVETVALSK